jgi:hypothetical protein
VWYVHSTKGQAYSQETNSSSCQIRCYIRTMTARVQLKKNLVVSLKGLDSKLIKNGEPPDIKWLWLWKLLSKSDWSIIKPVLHRTTIWLFHISHNPMHHCHCSRWSIILCTTLWSTPIPISLCFFLIMMMLALAGILYLPFQFNCIFPLFCYVHVFLIGRHSHVAWCL